MKTFTRWFIVVPMLMTGIAAAFTALLLVWAGQTVFFKIKRQPVYLVGVPTIRALAQRIHTTIAPNSTPARTS